MRFLIGSITLALLALSAGPAFAQFGGGGGGGGGITGTGDAAAQNLPSTVGVGRQTGNGYYSGVGGGEPFSREDGSRLYYGRSAYRHQRSAPVDAYGVPYAEPRVRGYGYGFGRYPY